MPGASLLLVWVSTFPAEDQKALKEHPLADGMQGVKALDVAIKLERTILGEPSETTGLSIQAVTRRELETLIEFDDGEPDEA